MILSASISSKSSITICCSISEISANDFYFSKATFLSIDFLLSLSFFVLEDFFYGSKFRASSISLGGKSPEPMPSKVEVAEDGISVFTPSGSLLPSWLVAEVGGCIWSPIILLNLVDWIWEMTDFECYLYCFARSRLSLCISFKLSIFFIKR